MNDFMLYFLGIVFGIYFVYIQEQWFFKLTNDHYCHKFNGNCIKCDCWSCEKFQILHK